MSDTKTKAYLTTTLFHQQDLHPWIYHIQTGFVIVYGISANGKQGLTDIYGPDSWFGPGLNDGIAVQNAVAQNAREEVLEKNSYTQCIVN